MRTKIRFIFDRSQQKTVTNKQFTFSKIAEIWDVLLSTSFTENKLDGTLQEKWKLKQQSRNSVSIYKRVSQKIKQCRRGKEHSKLSLQIQRECKIV